MFNRILHTFLLIIIIGNSACNQTLTSGRLSKLPETITQIREFDSIKVLGSFTKSMTIQYLGSGGLYLLRNNEGILIDPFFSNQKVLKLAASVLFNSRNVKSSKKKVKFGLNAIDRSKGQLNNNLKAIFSAHSHFDHLLDVPAVYKETGEQAKVYLNQSGYNICNKVISHDKMVVLEKHMTTNEKQRPPIRLVSANGNINVYPILADHNPHLKFIKAFDGDITKPDNCFENVYGKTRANDWLEGNTFSFVIDYLDSRDSIELRIFVQSSSCNPMTGIPPNTLPPHNFDIAFLGVASYGASPDYPRVILETLKPKKVVWLHWEDFFRNYKRKPKTVRGTDVRKFFNMSEVVGVASKSYLPWPRAVFEVVY